MAKTALIFGVTGQDGSYLSEILLDKGYEVHGVKRRSSQLNTERVDHLYEDPHVEDPKFILHYGDLTDGLNVTRLIKDVQPNEIFNLGAMSHVKVSFEMPEFTAQTAGLGLLRILESVRLLGLENKVRIAQASSSEMFGKVAEVPQSETTPFHPRSPYASAKVFAHHTGVNYREAYGMFVSNVIMFNHESPRRGETFVTRKITQGVARIKAGKQDCLFLGNLNAERDWGHAREYMEAMHGSIQLDDPDDFVIATGNSVSVRDMARHAFEVAGIGIGFRGERKNEVAEVRSVLNESRNHLIGKTVIAIDPNYYRPTEVDSLIGDATKAKNVLGWEPKVTWQELIREMVEADSKAIRNE